MGCTRRSARSTLHMRRQGLHQMLQRPRLDWGSPTSQQEMPSLRYVVVCAGPTVYYSQYSHSCYDRVSAAVPAAAVLRSASIQAWWRAAMGRHPRPTHPRHSATFSGLQCQAFGKPWKWMSPTAPLAKCDRTRCSVSSCDQRNAFVVLPLAEADLDSRRLSSKR